MPGNVVLVGEPVHADGQKDVRDSSLFGSSEITRADADDFEGLATDVDGVAEDVRITTEAVIPIIPGEDRIGTFTGAAVIGGRKQAAERGPKAEEGEHVAGDIGDVGLLHSSSVDQVMSARSLSLMAMRSAWSLTASRMSLNAGVAQWPSSAGLPYEADHLAGEDVEPAGTGDGQRAPEQGVDKTEGGDTRADAESEGKHSGHGRDLVAAELPPAETYIGEKRLKPSGNTNAVARLAGMQRGAECTMRFLGITT